MVCVELVIYGLGREYVFEFEIRMIYSFIVFRADAYFGMSSAIPKIWLNK